MGPQNGPSPITKLSTNLNFSRSTTKMDFEAVEDVDGVRLPWNCFPASHLDAASMSVPLSCLYTPLQENVTVVEDNPILSSGGTVLSPFCHVDTQTSTWSCPVSLSRNKLAAGAELAVQIPLASTTVEYILPKTASASPVYLFIVDVATSMEELRHLRTCLEVSLSLPESAVVGVMSVGKNVNFYELDGTPGAIVCHTFDGSKLYSKSELARRLGLISADIRSPILGTVPGSKFFQPLGACEPDLRLIFENMLEEEFPKKNTERKQRATGLALSLAVSLLENCYPKTAVEILAFLSGPCDYGKFGAITTTHLKDHLRSHKDIQSHNSSYQGSSKLFYSELARRASRNGYVTNFFIGSIDQVGLFEMIDLAELSGGIVVYSDTFSTAIFQGSFKRYIQQQIEGEEYAVNGSLEVKTSHNLKINGMIGNAVSLNKAAPNVSEKVIGLGESNSWKLPKVTLDSTYCVYLEINKNGSNQDIKQAFIQFLFYYQHPDGRFRLRVTTICRPVHDFNSQKHLFAQSFDQEAAIVAVARETSYKVFHDLQPPQKAQENLDTVLVKLMKNFSNSNTDKLEVDKNISMLPQFFYHLGRSFILRLFNYSPDESVYYNHVFFHENVNNSMIMIQPVLISYEQDPLNPEETLIEPVLLDSVSVKPTRILLLDSFFEIVVYHGATIANWCEQGYQDDPQYEHFKNFLELPKNEVKNILIDRYPLPRFVDCDEGGSQTRFLYSKLNPSNSYNSENVHGGGGAIILTEDMSLQRYLVEISKKVSCSGS